MNSKVAGCASRPPRAGSIRYGYPKRANTSTPYTSQGPHRRRCRPSFSSRSRLLGGAPPAMQPRRARGGDHEHDETADATQERLRTGRAGPASPQGTWSRARYRAAEDAAAPNLALVPARLTRELRADAAPHPGGPSTAHRALYPV